MKNVEQTIPRADLPLNEGTLSTTRRDSSSRFVHYKSDVAAVNLPLDAVTTQTAERIKGNANLSSSAPRWARGTNSPSSEETTTLIDSAEFGHLLAAITPSPVGGKSSKLARAETVEADDSALDSDYELTQVRFDSCELSPFDSPVVSSVGRPQQEAMTMPVSSLSSEEATMLSRPASKYEAAPPAPVLAAYPASVAAPVPVAAYPVPVAAPGPVPLSYEGAEHTAILSNEQRQDWLKQNAPAPDKTAILSGPQVAQWLSKPAQPSLAPEPWVEFTPNAAAAVSPAQAPFAPMGALPQPPVLDDMAQGTLSATDEDLFALPHHVSDKHSDKAASKLGANIFLGIFAVLAILGGLAFALPAERAKIQERIFPTATAPVVISSQPGKLVVVPASKSEFKLLDTERLMSKAAAAVTSGRRGEALKTYQQLAAAHPENPLYANLVHALKVSEVTK